MTRILLDIETCPEWVVPATSDTLSPLPERFVLAAEATRRAKAPVRWAGIDAARVSGVLRSDWKPEYLKELDEIPELAEELAMDGALNPLFGRIVAIGVQFVGADPSVMLLQAPKAGDEAPMLRSLVKTMSHMNGVKLEPHVVTYRGHGFDLPFLRFRCLKHGTPLPHFSSVDLSFELPCVRSFTGAPQVPKLSEACEALGLPPTDDQRGAEVPRLVRAGRMDEVLRHLACDIDRLSYLDELLGRP